VIGPWTERFFLVAAAGLAAAITAWKRHRARSAGS
jgi:hypothetical protein